ncbi:CZB domain-containing protein [Shewanella submarina]|uniref:CZB domain-containing protein n=1 Tax=Shewanella submarina TaxID=2016376 RepID=A0ABV7G9L7_9GAMM|nr:CZB domain-containing protein [Shewanella submarina]MCL1039330.1 CZB domain-containing protein [Shewanella submarina]
MDFINFKVGQKMVAFKILDILQTEKHDGKLTSLPNNTSSFMGVRDYANKPVPIFDLGIMLNGVSTGLTNQELIKLLADREEDHVTWFKTLRSTIEEGTPFTKACDPHECAFAQWYDSFQTDNEDFADLLKKFDAPHKQLHALAGEVLELLERDEKEQALKAFRREEHSSYATLMRLFGVAKDQLALDYKPIIVFTTRDGITPDIGLLVDKVEDSVDVEEQDIHPMDDLAHLGFNMQAQTTRLVRGLIHHNNKHSLIMEPRAIVPDPAIINQLSQLDAAG